MSLFQLTATIFSTPVFSGSKHGGNGGVFRAKAHAAGRVDAHALIDVSLICHQGGGYASGLNVLRNLAGMQNLQGLLIQLE